MAIKINQKDCLVSRKNLGLPDCIIQEGMLTGFMIVPKGWEVNLTTDTFDKTYVQAQIQAGMFVPILGAVQAENKTPEATIEEFQGGIKAVVRNGLPEYTFKYVKGGWKYASALYTYNSFQAFDVLFVFSTGAIAGASDGTTLSGFDLGMLNNGTYMFTDGTASSHVLVSMQLINETQFNRDVALLDPTMLDFNPNQDLYPITDIVLTGRADVSDNKVYFKAKFAMNQSQDLLGIAQANIKSYKDGATDTITALSLTFDTTTREYSYTPSTPFTVANIFLVTLWDATANVNVAKIGTRFYKGQSGNITPVA
jgi:hypothetical protein